MQSKFTYDNTALRMQIKNNHPRQNGRVWGNRLWLMAAAHSFAQTCHSKCFEEIQTISYILKISPLSLMIRRKLKFPLFLTRVTQAFIYLFQIIL